MKPNIKTVPNQKVVRVNKEPTDGTKKENYYATINLNALNAAAADLKPGAFKLWMYFAMNQNNYEFALSSAAVAEEFGIKRDMYNTAVKELTDKGYLVLNKGNSYNFYEKPVVVKTNNVENSVVGKTNNDVVGKSYNVLPEKTTTCCSKIPQEILQNNIHNTLDNTEEIDELLSASLRADSSISQAAQEEEEYQRVSKREMLMLGVPYEVVDESKNLYKILATQKIVRAV